jgi:hypothetical protein
VLPPLHQPLLLDCHRGAGRAEGGPWLLAVCWTTLGTCENFRATPYAIKEGPDQHGGSTGLRQHWAHLPMHHAQRELAWLPTPHDSMKYICYSMHVNTLHGRICARGGHMTLCMRPGRLRNGTVLDHERMFGNDICTCETGEARIVAALPRITVCMRSMLGVCQVTRPLRAHCRNVHRGMTRVQMVHYMTYIVPRVCIEYQMTQPVEADPLHTLSGPPPPGESQPAAVARFSMHPTHVPDDELELQRAGALNFHTVSHHCWPTTSCGPGAPATYHPCSPVT